jgi:MFS family permease
MAIDKKGARWSLVLSMAGAGVGYALLALSVRAPHAIMAIIAARAVIGIFKQTQTIAKAALAAVTPHNVRLVR